MPPTSPFSSRRRPTPANVAEARGRSPRGPPRRPAATPAAREAVLGVVAPRQREARRQWTAAVEAQDLQARLPRRVAPAGDERPRGPGGGAVRPLQHRAHRGGILGTLDDAHDHQPARPVAELGEDLAGRRGRRRSRRARGSPLPRRTGATQPAKAATTSARSANTSGMVPVRVREPADRRAVRRRSCRRTRRPRRRSGGRAPTRTVEGSGPPASAAGRSAPTKADGIEAGLGQEVDDPSGRRRLAVRPGDPDERLPMGRGGVGDELLHAAGGDAAAFARQAARGDPARPP